MKFNLTRPCAECPFLEKMRHGFSARKLAGFAEGAFPCHLTADVDDDLGEYVARPDSQMCAGMMIFLEKRESPNQMMRVAERLGLYDHKNLDMTAKVR